MAAIAIFNQNGGGGKTTTALNLWAGLALLKTDPLAIDLDPQVSSDTRVRGEVSRRRAQRIRFF